MVTKESGKLAAQAGKRGIGAGELRLAPIAWAVAVAMTAAPHAAHAQQAFSSAWFASKGATQNSAAATGYLPNGTPAALLTNPAQQQQQANAQLQRSINNLSALARGIAAQQAAQEAARQAALANGGSVPDGLAEGGLKVDTNSLTRGWINANAPTQSSANGKTTVSVQQTADRAILNWESFNVGQNTILQFAQQPAWAVLNRVNDPQGRPSQIQGQISAPGTVLIANRNGIVFAGSSQVDTRNLVAAAAGISDAQFKNNGIYSVQASGTYTPSFTDANGALIVEAGARIGTAASRGATQGGGYALLLGREVSNAGSVITPGGQVQLAAGDFFIVRPGQNTSTNQYSTTRGNEIAPRFNPGSTAGSVSNTGYLAAAEGDVTLAGRSVLQDGVALATTSVNARGTIHLLSPASDAQSSVTLAPGSNTAVLLSDNGATALDSQRAALITQSGLQDGARRAASFGVFDNLSRQDDRQDQSRVEIVSGGNVNLAGGSATLATGGQVAISAGGRTMLGDGALLDVSGAVGVNVAMASNNVQINVQGNEQRDAPLNRDSLKLNNSNVWIDRRSLTYVPAGTGGYAGERWYTAGGLLEVGGYLGLAAHGVGEWMAQGGSVAFAGAELVTQPGSSINLSGGSLNVQTGYLRQSWLKGADGQLYELSRAPADVAFTGLYKGFENTHARWGDKTTEYFYNPLIAPQQRLENGYTAGRDAGRMIVATGSAVLEGGIVSAVYQGPQQTQKGSAALDGYRQSQRAAAMGAQLVLGSYASAINVDPVMGPLGVFHNLQPTFSDVVFTDDYAAIAGTLQGAGNIALPAALQGKAYIDSGLLNGFGLGSILAAGKNRVSAEGALAVLPGGSIGLYAPQVNINADLSARGGAISAGNIVAWTTAAGQTIDSWLAPAAGQQAWVKLAAGVTLDASGLWSNAPADGGDVRGLPYVNGGTVSVRSTGDVTLPQGSVIDVSSGAALLPTGALQGGRGGDVTLAAGYVTDRNATPSATAQLTLEGALRAYGVDGGGTLTLQSGVALGIGGKLLATDGLLPAGQAAPANLRLLQDFQLAAGERAPMDLSVVLTRRPAGYVVGGTSYIMFVISAATSVTTQAAWRLPANLNTSITDIQGHVYAAGSLMPAGTVIAQNFRVPPGFVIPPDVFPDGLPINPTKVVYQAGSLLDVPVKLAAGSVLGAGAVLTRPVAVAPTGVLSSALFQTGFSRYGVTAGDGIVVQAGTALQVDMPVLRTDGAALSSLASGSRLADRLAVWLPPLYQEDAAHARLVQRGGASLELDAGSRTGGPGLFSPLTVGTGAHLAVDPGQNITLWSNGGQVTLDGRLDAWGGAISITSSPAGAGLYQASTGRSIWIGENAVLDAAARSYVARDSQGRAYGVAPDGGSIDIGLSDSFIVIRPGALLDASGAYAEIDAAAGGAPGAPARPVALAGAGGSIGLHSYVGMVLDGRMLARAGGAGAAGGSLTLEMANRLYLPSAETISAEIRVLHNITLSQRHQPGGLTAGLAPGRADPGLKYGQAALGADQVRDGGFDALTLSTHDLFVFDGNIDLALGRSLNLRNGFLTVAQATPDAQVRLAAPYIRLDGGVWEGAPGYFSPGIVLLPFVGAPAPLGASSLTLDAGLIDIYGRVQSGVKAYSNTGPTVPNDESETNARRDVVVAGFSDLVLNSAGDIRLSNAALVQAGDMSLTAAQIYPASGQRGMLVAGLINDPANSANYWDSSRSLVIRSSGAAAPVPDSVFGRLIIIAPTLDQGGVVRAPLGTIALNDRGGSIDPLAWLNVLPFNASLKDMRLTLRSGSLTSVSAAGLVMPYGGTSDGLTYRGADGTLFSLGANAGQRNNGGNNFSPDGFALLQGIALGGGSVAAEAGSVLDLSGGGDLRGAGFISGRGGSVDILTTPLANANPAAYRRSSSAGNAVYAIMPGYASDYAPLIADKGAGDPAIGRQVTIGAGVPGLSAGTYTLLPASFALLPGAWRVEVGQHASTPAGAVATTTGSWSTTGTLGTAGTGIRDSLPSQLLVTPGQAVRKFSQYNETGYADFAVKQAALFGNVRPLLPSDGKILNFFLRQNDNLTPLQLGGSVLLDPAAGGVRGQVSVFGDKPIEIAGGAPSRTAGVITLSADSLSALRASTLSIGGIYQYFDGKSNAGDSARIYFDAGLSEGGTVTVQSGATLRAGQIFLIGNQINVDAGAVLDTRGMGQPGVDSRNGFVYANATGNASSSSTGVLAVSNGRLDLLPSIGNARIGVDDGAALLTEGTIAFAAPGALALGDVNLGARYLAVSQNQINIGTAASLAAAQAAGAMQPGWQLSQATLDRLLRPSSSAGVPALERLSLTAGGAFNFYGSLTLDTGDSPVQMVFNTPAFYGLGTGSDVVRIVTRDFVWNGIATGNGTAASPYVAVQPVAVQPGGPGTGSGTLVIDARQVLFGYDALSWPQRQAELGRLALGFGNVSIQAADRVTANSRGSLSVGLTQDANGILQGGALSIVTPLLTGQAGSAMRYAAGGAVSLSRPAGAAPAATAAIGELGASLTVQGASVTVDTALALPSGVLKIAATGDIRLGDGAQIDLSGRGVSFYDLTRYSWGGDVTLTSGAGSIIQAGGSRIDVSAANNDAGSLTLEAAQGAVSLGGALAASGRTGFADGRFGLTVAQMSGADFTRLNQQLNRAGFFDARSFVVKNGDLSVGDGVRARQVSIAADGGSLIVDGVIDASAQGAGSITLAARNDLVLTGRAVLDAHGTALVSDSYGVAIEASNRARIALSTVGGTLRLNSGATLDLRSADGVSRGRLDLNAPRVGSTGGSATGAGAPANATGGDIAIDAAGPLTIRGAQSIALNGVARYANAPTDAVDANTQLIDQAYLDLIDQDSRAFDAAARANAGLQARVAGLAAYGSAFHLRPGVDIVSAGANGNLVVKGDLDLSGYRYGPNADRNTASASYGAGEPMALAIRAGGDLQINGSINDGFAPPPATPDDNGWQLREQVLVTGQPAHGGVYPLPLDPNWNDHIYYFPSGSSGVGFPVVTSGSITDDFGTYGPGDTIWNGFLYGTVTVAPGTIVTSTTPGGADMLLSGPRPEPGRMWAIAPMLAAGSLSASIRLASGADLAAADARRLQAPAQLAGRGNMVLDDLHLAATTSASPMQAPSVVRTGTGDLELYVGGNYRQESLFGVYTAGTVIAPQDAAGYNAARATLADGSVLGASNSAYEATLTAQRMWFTGGGGDFTLAAQGDIAGYLQPNSLSTGDWLWRQGGAEIGQRTAWGVNFGSYVNDGGSALSQLGWGGFAGVGALGGGNATIRAGGDIGVAGDQWRGLLAAVAGSGRVNEQGQLLQTGGGALDVKAGGRISGGQFANLRGDARMAAADVGSLALAGFGTPNFADPRAVDAHVAYSSARANAVSLAPGDGQWRINTLGDIVLSAVVDPGRVAERVETQAGQGSVAGSAASWFTLWTDRTALNLFSAGGNVSPFGSGSTDKSTGVMDLTNYTLTMPAILSAVAAGGSIYFAEPFDGAGLMMPSPQGHLDLLARGLISGDASNSGYIGNNPIGPLGASAATMATPLHPAWRILDSGANPRIIAANYWGDFNNTQGEEIYGSNTSSRQQQGSGGLLFMFGRNTVTDDSMAGDGVLSHIYAVNGDIMKLELGQIRSVSQGTGLPQLALYQASKPVRMLAGGDIVNSMGLIVHGAATDVSMISADGSILYTNFTVAGPGNLEVSAGGQIYQGSQSSFTSAGAIALGDLRPGADITVAAGLGKGAPGQGGSDFAGFARRYLDPANRIDASLALADQPGKVVHTYERELASWLQQRFGYAAASTADAIAYFDALAPEQQRIFLRQVYYAELTAGGREYNDPASKRFGSYLRGREAIAALFPEQDAAGRAILRAGDLTLFQGALKNAGLRTIAGGDIQILTPGGKTVLGVEGITPSTDPGAAPAGLITQGDGDIQIYSQGSILLGLSRVMTTFGGNILAWSAQGDINAGRGSKTTLVYTPPKREYDPIGNVKVSPNVPSSGAGIATLAPIPEVPPGDVDLIAPLGTIDAGEAGIRVSGNVNIAALQVVNAANIQVQGKSTGLPVVAAVNVGALTNASAAASSAAMAAQDAVARERAAARQNLPSVFTVRVLGFGADPADGAGARSGSPSTKNTSGRNDYDPASAVQLIGVDNNFDAAQLARLSEAQRRRLQQNR